MKYRCSSICVHPSQIVAKDCRSLFKSCRPAGMGLITKDDGWRIPEELWSLLEPLLPPRPAHPLGCHNPRVPDRDAMNAILFVLRTGCHWNARHSPDFERASSPRTRPKVLLGELGALCCL